MINCIGWRGDLQKPPGLYKGGHQSDQFVTDFCTVITENCTVITENCHCDYGKLHCCLGLTALKSTNHSRVIFLCILLIN